MTGFRINTPTGVPFEIPVDVGPACGFAALTDLASRRAHFETHGYVVVRQLVEPSICDTLVEQFRATMKPFGGAIDRYRTGRPEAHEIDAEGRMVNAILGAHRVTDAALAPFVAAQRAVVCAPAILAHVAAFLGEEPALRETFFFEKNAVTEIHRDLDFQPHLGRIAAAWVALEDIAPGAGRLYLYPGSHRERDAREVDAMDPRYRERLLDEAKRKAWECVAPAMAKGDVAFFDGQVAHGALETRQAATTRLVTTAHFYPASASSP